MYTAASAFLDALWDAGVSHCFVNLGSDHPSIIEAMVKGARERKHNFPRMITCPSEMVAMSMADGFARVTNQPQAVIVHVDVGTQALGCAVHNASAGRAPVLIFAGLSPFTMEGEMVGSRTEFIHWIQDIPDQKSIVAQYCRYVGEFKTGKNVKQITNRALQFARSQPRGPVYLAAAREVMEEEVECKEIKQDQWEPVELGVLPEPGVKEIADALVNAREPLVITGYAGRNHEWPATIVELANTVKGLKVLDTGGCDMSFPADHPAWLGFRFSVAPEIKTADVILVVDCDVPWINVHNTPMENARIFHIDCDPLKQMMPVFYLAAQKRFRADSLLAIRQITSYLKTDQGSQLKLSSQEFSDRWNQLQLTHQQRLAAIDASAVPFEDGSFGAPFLTKTLRGLCPQDTIWTIEAVTSTIAVADGLQATLPGSWINCGGGGLGWFGGAQLGIKLATDWQAEHAGLGKGKGKFVCAIVGDGTFLFSIPGSVYWISRRYNIPVLTIVLNNGGWNAPRKSLQLVHPNGLGANTTNEEINISFSPVPDYSGIAKASAGGELFAARVERAEDLEGVLKEAIESVKGGISAVVDCRTRVVKF